MSQSEKLYRANQITRPKKTLKKNQNPLCVWFTGLSGSGKSTLINALNIHLLKKDFHTYVLDGDSLRNGLCRDLDFSMTGRDENLRRAAEVAKLMLDAGLIVLAGFISPTLDQRTKIRKLFNCDEFIEVYVSTSLDVCEKRDVKGLYIKARRGDIKDFTGVDSIYEAPQSSEITIDTEGVSIEVSLKELIRKLKL